MGSSQNAGPGPGSGSGSGSGSGFFQNFVSFRRHSRMTVIYGGNKSKKLRNLRRL